MAREMENVEDRRQEALDRALSQIEKEYGKGAIMPLGADVRAEVPAIPTGSLSLDIALGVGGVPRGRVVEIFGPEASGKTTLALQIVANAQRLGGIAAYIDAEHALDTAYAKKIGVDVESLLVSQPSYGEQALDIGEMLVRSNAVDVVVIDSVAALVPKAEIEGEMEDQQVGLQARLMSKALRKLTGAISKSRTCVIFINQIREKIGIMFGNPETTPGGRALKFYASVRIETRRIGNLKHGEETIGSRTRATVQKNKVAPPFKKAEFDLLYDRGISYAGDVVDTASELGVIQKSGAWYQYGDVKLGQGRENARDYLEQHPDLLNEITDKVYQRLGIRRRIEVPPVESTRPQKDEEKAASKGKK